MEEGREGRRKGVVSGGRKGGKEGGMEGAVRGRKGGPDTCRCVLRLVHNMYNIVGWVISQSPVNNVVSVHCDNTLRHDCEGNGGVALSEHMCT